MVDNPSHSHIHNLYIVARLEKPHYVHLAPEHECKAKHPIKVHEN